jgi:glutaredoxin-related protein
MTSRIVFYSNKCGNCTNFKKYINDNNMTNEFIFNSVDNMSLDEIIKLGIHCVPAICIDDHNNLYNEVYEGAKAFEWIHNNIKT